MSKLINMLQRVLRAGLKKIFTSRETVIFLIAVTLLLTFSILSHGKFLQPRVINLISTAISELGLLSLGVAMLMISGEFDLSVGSIAAMASLVVASLYRLGVNPFLALLVAVGIGCVIGIINGLITVKFEIPSFITTLGTMMLLRGLIYVFTEGLPISFPVSGTHPSFANFFQGDLGIVAAPFIWFVIASIIFWLLLNHHRFGNHVFATGGGKEAARSMGINIDRTKIICFMMTAGLASLYGIMHLTRVLTFHATQELNVELMSIAAVVVGGVSIFGGKGNITGAVIGVIIIEFLEFGLIFAGISGFWYKVLLGALIIIVVVTNRQLDKWKKV